MEKRLLITRSKHDLYNQYLYPYCDSVLSEAEKHSWKSYPAENEQNTRSNVHSRIGKNQPNFVFFNGHGTEDGLAVCGYKNEIILDSGSASCLSGRIVFSRSCYTLSGLGKLAVNEHGCSAFIGHTGLFIIPHSDEYESTPNRNPLAKPVLEVSNLAATHILKGDTVENSVAASIGKANELMLKMLVSREPADAAILRALYKNSSNLGFEGNPNARL